MSYRPIATQVCRCVVDTRDVPSKEQLAVIIDKGIEYASKII